MLLQCKVKDPGYSADSEGGRLHLNTHTSLTQRSQSGLSMPLSRHSVGTYQETSSHAARQGTLDHSRLSSLSHCGLILAKRVELVYALWTEADQKGGISVRELISTLKKALAGNELSNILPKSSHSRKKPPAFTYLLI